MRSIVITLIAFLISCNNAYSQADFKSELKNFRKALDENPDAYTRILKEFEDENSIKLKECKNRYLLYKKCGAFFFENAMDKEALILQRDSVLAIQKRCLVKDDPALIVTYFNIAQAYDWLGEIHQAEKYYMRVATMQQKTKKILDFESNNYSEMGAFYTMNGDFEKASFYYDMAAKTYLEKSKNIIYARILLGKAKNLYDLGKYSEAIKNLEKALIVTEALLEDIESSYILRELSKNKRKLSFFKSAEEDILQAISLVENKKEKYQSDLNIYMIEHSHVLKDWGKYQESHQVLSSLKNNIGKHNDKITFSKISGLQENIADIYFEEGKLSQAIKHYQKGIRQLVEFRPKALTDNPTVFDKKILNQKRLQRQLGLKSKALFALAKKENNSEYYASVIDAVLKFDTLSQYSLLSNWEESTHQHLIERSREYYENGVESALNLLMLENDKIFLEKAHNICSRFKAQLLARGININAKKKKVLSDSLRMVEKRLKKNISQSESIYKADLLSNDSIAIANSFKNYFDEKINLEYFLTEHGVWESMPKTDVRKIPTLKELQSLLSHEEGILEYFKSGDIFHSFLITKDEIYYEEVFLTASNVQAYFNYLDQRKEEFNDKLFSSELLKVLDQIELRNLKRLIIIPDQELLQIPFEALKLGGTKMVIEHLISSYSFSTNMLFNEIKKNPKGKPLVMASDYSHPNFMKDDYFLSEPLKELTFAVQEAKGIGEQLNSDLFLNEETIKPVFIKHVENASLIHLALHSQLNTRFPDQSSLVFESDERDYFLRASEIYNLDLNAKLTVLSACNTGKGSLTSGEGVRSLARSFIHAGSESVLTSLWDAPDVSTSKVFGSFYESLNQGLDKDEALRNAKLEYINNIQPSFRHPRYWAHLVLIGKNTSSGFDDSSGLLSPLMLIVLFFVLFIIFKYFLNRKRKK